MDIESLKYPEFQEKLKLAKTPQEVLTLSKEEGHDLDEEEFDSRSARLIICQSRISYGKGRGFMSLPDKWENLSGTLSPASFENGPTSDPPSSFSCGC